MKSIIYISLVASILVGCKGNSFLTRKYTKYGHAIARKSENAKSREHGSQAIVKNEPKRSVEIEKEENSVSVPVVAETNAMPLPLSLAKALVKLPKKIATRVNTGNEESVNDAEPLNLSAKSDIKTGQKIKKSKEDGASKAIVGKILKIIILVLMLAIVLAVIFILMALSVI